MRRSAEQHFVLGISLAIVLKLVAIVALGILGKKAGASTQTILTLLPWVALALVAVSVFRLKVSSDKPIHIGGNRLNKQIIGWTICALILAVVWAYGAGYLGKLPKSYKAFKAILNSLDAFSDVIAVFSFLVAAALTVIGSIDDGATTTPGKIEKIFVKNLTAKVAAVPMVLVSLGIFIGATLWTVYHSFTKSGLLPKSDFVGLAQYERLWTSNRWWISIENLAIYGICSMIFSLLIGFMLAALLDQKIRFENTFRTIFLYPFALSFIVTGLVWQWILTPEFGVQKIVRDMGFENFTFDPLYNADIVIYGILIAGLWQGTGLIMCLMLAGLRGIDEDIWKAARVDGIPMWKTYLFIVIPMMRPVFITTLVLIASGIVRVYDLVVAQTSGGPGLASEVPAKYVYDTMFGGQNLGQGFAASTMMLLSVLVIVVPWAILEFKEQKQNG